MVYIVNIPYKKMSMQKKRVRDVIYPQIKECEKYVSDPFWKNLFDDLSRGRCPKSIVIFNNSVSSIYKRGGFNYNFQNKDPKEMAHDLVSILKSTGCIYSSSDIKLENEYNTSQKIKCYSSWKQIKTKKIKQQYVYDFVIRKSNEYKLTDTASKKLIRLINSSLHEYKTHRSDDIIFENNQIDSIIDIEYDDELKEFVNVREIEDRDDCKIENNLIKKSWEQYVIKVYRDSKTYSE